jgi:hypothetical protein
MFYLLHVHVGVGCNKRGSWLSWYTVVRPTYLCVSIWLLGHGQAGVNKQSVCPILSEQ